MGRPPKDDTERDRANRMELCFVANGNRADPAATLTPLRRLKERLNAEATHMLRSAGLLPATSELVSTNSLIWAPPTGSNTDDDFYAIISVPATSDRLTDTVAQLHDWFTQERGKLKGELHVIPRNRPY